jgi:hypothetical protein
MGRRTSQKARRTAGGRVKPAPTLIAGPSIDWAAAADEFRPREFGTLRQSAVAIPDANAEALSEMFDPHVGNERWHADAGPKLRAGFLAAARVPGGLPIFAAYLHGLCQKRWEHSVDHPTILRMANAAAETFATISPDDDTTDWRLARLLLDMGLSLASCMATENALNCSCPAAMARHAGAAAEVGRRVMDQCFCWPETAIMAPMHS